MTHDPPSKYGPVLMLPMERCAMRTLILFLLLLYDDIFVTNMFNRLNFCPNISHNKYLKRVGNYLKNHREQGNIKIQLYGLHIG